MESFIIFCLDFFITAIAYLLVPTIFCICRKKLKLSRIKLIVIVNGICVWLAFMIIRINAGVDGTSAAVFLWSSVTYFLMKKHCLKISDDSEPIKKYVITQVKKTRLPNAQPRKPKKKRQPLIFIVVALSILLVASVTYNVIQYIIIQRHTEGIKYLEENILSTFYGYDEGNTMRLYEYDYKTHKYLDADGNEYKK